MQWKLRPPPPPATTAPYAELASHSGVCSICWGVSPQLVASRWAELAGTESQPVRCMFTRQRGLNDNARRGRLESSAPEQLIEPERELAIL
jgi:hypothetical protein